MDPEALYRQLAALAANKPDLMRVEDDYSIPAESQEWLGRLHALLEAGGMGIDAIKVMLAMDKLRDRRYKPETAHEIFAALHRGLAAAEIRAPVAVKGAFIPVAAPFEAFQGIGKVLESARRDALLVDPYMDQTVLTDFAPLAPEGIAIRLLTARQHMGAALEPAARRWLEQHGTARPLQVRALPAKQLHDRLIIVDSVKAWIITQSFKDFAKRAPAAIQRADEDAGRLKVDAYEEMWGSADPVIPS